MRYVSKAGFTADVNVDTHAAVLVRKFCFFDTIFVITHSPTFREVQFNLHASALVSECVVTEGPQHCSAHGVVYVGSHPLRVGDVVEAEV